MTTITSKYTRMDGAEYRQKYFQRFIMELQCLSIVPLSIVNIADVVVTYRHIGMDGAEYRQKYFQRLIEVLQ